MTHGAETGTGIAVRIHRGGGPPIAWVHGYTMDSSVWWPLWRLMPAWTHIGIDLPGHGASRPLAADERLNVLGQRVADVCAAHGVRHIVGLSFGATVALQAAIEVPDGFWSLVLAAPAVAGAPTDPGSEVRYTQLAELYARYGPGPHMTRLWMASPPKIFQAARAHTDLWKQLQSVIDRHKWQELADGAMRSLSAHVQEPAALHGVAASTLVILGEEDMPAFRYSAGLIARHVPRCRAMLVPRAGHLCLLEQPETVAAVIAKHVGTAEPSLLKPPSS